MDGCRRSRSPLPFKDRPLISLQQTKISKFVRAMIYQASLEKLFQRVRIHSRPDLTL